MSPIVAEAVEVLLLSAFSSIAYVAYELHRTTINGDYMLVFRVGEGARRIRLGE